MSTKNKNANLLKAQKLKNDEYYTLLKDVEKELKYYTDYFKNKVVFCNCNDGNWSAFWQYFHLNFSKLKLKKLYSTEYNKDTAGKLFTYRGGSDEQINSCECTVLNGNGSYDSEECIDLLKEADIVCTNPPFSRLKNYIPFVMNFNKDMLIISNLNSVTYSAIFPYFADEKIRIGYNSVNKFQSGSEFKIFHNIYWFTTFETSQKDSIKLTQRYYDDNGNVLPESLVKYPKYDNYDAINVDRLKDIPYDYKGKIGVPITLVTKTLDFKIIANKNSGLVIGGECVQENYHSESLNTSQQIKEQSMVQENMEELQSVRYKILGYVKHGSDSQYDFAKPFVLGAEKYTRLIIERLS